MNPFATEVFAVEHRRDLISEASHERLITAATCCRRHLAERIADAARAAKALVGGPREPQCCIAA